MRLTPLHGPRRINSEVHAGWCSPRTSNPVVPILSGRSVRFRLTSAKALKPAGLSPQWAKRMGLTFFLVADDEETIGHQQFHFLFPRRLLNVVTQESD